MRKVYHLLAALVLGVLGVANASAGERVSLTADMVYSYQGFGEDAVKGAQYSEAVCILGEPANTTFGDSNCNAGVDLSGYSKLYIKVRAEEEGKNPRIFINRTADNGQFNPDKAKSQCLVIPNAGTWAENFYTVDENDKELYIIDLKKIAKEWSFVRLHSVKGPSYNTNCILASIEAEKADAGEQVGWTSIINNGNMEGEDVNNFRARIWPDESKPVPEAEITDGVGTEESRGIKVAATEKHANAWDNQFFIRFNEALPAGTRYKISFDYRADVDAKVSTQAHAEPGDYIHYEMLGDLNFTTDWQTYTSGEQTVTEKQSTAEKTFQTLTFNLNELADANNYYFDNIDIQVFKLGTSAEFNSDVVKVDFGFGTNIAELVKATGKPRLVYPADCATVTVNGNAVELLSVEAFADGRFYIFLEDAVSDNDEVVIAFKNPTDAAYRLKYTSGAVSGQDVKDFNDVAATYYDEVEEDAYAYEMVTPIIIAADPENGSFNLPNSIKDFKVTFDKNVNCEKIVATLNGRKMTATPSDGLASEITFTREGTEDLATGTYTINITKIYPEIPLDESIFGDTTYTVSIGKVEYDPEDQPKAMFEDFFAQAAANSIPEGWYVKFGNEERPGQSTYGSGSRMFDFGAGGDFTKGLYFREGYAEYGSTPGYELTLEAGKRYDISFKAAMWKDNGNKMRVELLDAQDETVYFVKVVDCTPNVNGSTSAVNGAASYTFKYYPEMTGNYILRFTSTDSETGAPAYKEVLLADPVVKYMPDQIGLEETQLLNTALANAKKVFEENADARYAGEAYTALETAIVKYEREKEAYTNPSAFTNAAAALDALAQGVKDHRANCDNYDTQIKKAIDVVRQNKENKFAQTDLYTELTEIVAKYHGTSEWVNTNEDPEADPTWVLNYSYDILTDDAALKAAVEELTDIANTTSLLFTEGKSAVGGSNGGKQTGVAVLIDRLRLGADALKSLGIGEEDADIVAANNALTDDDATAARLQRRLTKEVYEKIAAEGAAMFDGGFDEATQENIAKTVDMTVFVKNPNIYKQKNSMDFTAENVPGWTTPAGYNKPGLSVGWGNPLGNDKIAEDCMFQTWGGAYRVEQTIENLPAGVYTIKMGYGERNDDGNIDGSFIYVKKSDTPAVEEGGEEEIEVNFAGVANASVIGQSFPFAANNNALAIENITVTDGKLTIGVNAPSNSHTFFNDVQILLTAPAAGFDYANAKLPGILGDANGDGKVDIEDIVGIVNKILGEPADNFDEANADLNGDSKIDVDDVVAVINIILDSNTAAAPKFAKYLIQNGFKF